MPDNTIITLDLEVTGTNSLLGLVTEQDLQPIYPEEISVNLAFPKYDLSDDQWGRLIDLISQDVAWLKIHGCTVKFVY